MWLFGDGFQGLRPSEFKDVSFSLRARFVKKKMLMVKRSIALLIERDEKFIDRGGFAELVFP